MDIEKGTINAEEMREKGNKVGSRSGGTVDEAGDRRRKTSK
jgi:hypothetical protein